MMKYTRFGRRWSIRTLPRLQRLRPTFVSSTSVDDVRFATALPPPVRWATHPGFCENNSSPTTAAVVPAGAPDGDNNVGDDSDDDGAGVGFGDIDVDETATSRASRL